MSRISIRLFRRWLSTIKSRLCRRERGSRATRPGRERRSPSSALDRGSSAQAPVLFHRASQRFGRRVTGSAEPEAVPEAAGNACKRVRRPIPSTGAMVLSKSVRGGEFDTAGGGRLWLFHSATLNVTSSYLVGSILIVSSSLVCIQNGRVWRTLSSSKTTATQ